nr:MAG TPA: hypothetical protein [Caudoviricetes sp.]
MKNAPLFLAWTWLKPLEKRTRTCCVLFGSLGAARNLTSAILRPLNIRIQKARSVRLMP